MTRQDLVLAIQRFYSRNPPRHNKSRSRDREGDGMKIYTLAGISKRGKQIVKQHGERWECLKVLDTVLFSDKRGPWLYLEPVGELHIATSVREAKEETGARWVHSLTDNDFKVMP